MTKISHEVMMSEYSTFAVKNAMSLQSIWGIFRRMSICWRLPNGSVCTCEVPRGGHQKDDFVVSCSPRWRRDGDVPRLLWPQV